MFTYVDIASVVLHWFESGSIQGAHFGDRSGLYETWSPYLGANRRSRLQAGGTGFGTGGTGGETEARVHPGLEPPRQCGGSGGSGVLHEGMMQNLVQPQPLSGILCKSQHYIEHLSKLAFQYMQNLPF